MARRAESAANHSETLAKPKRNLSEVQATNIVLTSCLHASNTGQAPAQPSLRERFPAQRTILLLAT
jgi:hypothetical protein